MKFRPPKLSVHYTIKTPTLFTEPGLYHVRVESVRVDRAVKTHHPGAFTLELRDCNPPRTATLLVPFYPPKPTHNDGGNLAARKLHRLFIATNQIKPHEQSPVEIDERKMVGQQLVIRLRKGKKSGYQELQNDEIYNVSDPRVSDFDRFDVETLQQRSDELKDLDEAGPCYFGPILDPGWEEFYTFFEEPPVEETPEKEFFSTCTQVDSIGKVSTEQLYQAYLDFCLLRKIPPVKDCSLGKSLRKHYPEELVKRIRQRPANSQREAKRVWFYYGISLVGRGETDVFESKTARGIRNARAQSWDFA